MEPTRLCHNIRALAVFQNVLNGELIKSIHMYAMGADEDQGKNGGNDGALSVVQREFMFCPDSYKQIGSVRIMRGESKDFLEGFIDRVREGEEMGLWICILHYNSNLATPNSNIPHILNVDRNPALASVPELAEDLKRILAFGYLPGCSIRDSHNGSSVVSKNCTQNQNLDLEHTHSYVSSDVQSERVFRNENDGTQHDPSFLWNCQHVDKESPINNNESAREKVSKTENKQIRRAPSEHVSRIGLKDISNYFHLPICEASRRLNVGLTVLKRKCRELGIPRWPHRKIKSLDSLIHDLQEEVKKQETEDQGAARAALKRTRILESERQMIAKEPHIDIQKETKRFRQDIFKRRHRARVTNKQHEESSNSTSDDGDLSGDAPSVSTCLTLMINEDVSSPSAVIQRSNV